jgi:DNA-binding MarR family transcriptional regulator
MQSVRLISRFSLLDEARNALLLCVASIVLSVIDEDLQLPLDDAEEQVVRALARAIVVLPRLLDADLVREQRLALHEYEVLMHVSESPKRLLRMSDLAARCELSLSGITRIVARLEADGLLKRVTCDQDGRGTNAVLTYRGLKRLQAAWPTHLASVRRHIIDHLGEVDLPRLSLALQRFGTVAEPADTAR